MNSLEAKIDKLIEDNDFIKKEIGVLTSNVRTLNTTVESLAMSTSREFETVRSELKEAKEELLEKLATKETVADHEARILKLEHQEA